MYSVVLEEVNGKRYYRKSRKKYHIPGETEILKSIPEDTTNRMQFYYYTLSGWVFDEEAYQDHVRTMQTQEETESKTDITQEELLAAMMELAQNQNDIENAIMELAGTEE